MLVLHDGLAIGIHHIERQSAELGTLATVGTTAEAMLADVALTAIAHAQRPVHEDFERCLRYGLVYLANLLQREFACQDHLTESGFGQELHLACRAVVHLRAGMEGYRREVQAEQAHVLHNEGIDPGTIQVPNELLGFGELFVLQDGIEGDIDTDIVEVGILHQLGNVFQGVSGCCTGTETGRTDIYGVGTVVNRRDAAFQILGRSQKFYFSLSDHFISFISNGVS